MSFWESKKIKKTRKPHRCEYCGAKIPIGSSCRNEVGIWDGDFNHYYRCLRCVLFMDMFRDRQDEELGCLHDEVMDGNLTDCPKCESWNNRNYDWSDDMQSISLECDKCDHKWEVDLSLEALEKLQAKMKQQATAP